MEYTALPPYLNNRDYINGIEQYIAILCVIVNILAIVVTSKGR